MQKRLKKYSELQRENQRLLTFSSDCRRFKVLPARMTHSKETLQIFFLSSFPLTSHMHTHNNN